MTPKAQRIAIAEACGLKWQEGTEPTYGGRRGWFNPRTKRFSIAPPEYLNDLNSIHEAEAALNPHQRRNYPQALAHVCGIGEGVEWTADEDWTIIHATAAQRAEAFLRTIGKYKS